MLDDEAMQGGEEPDENGQAQMLVRLDLLGDSLCRTRAEAIDGRQQSGCEIQWQEDEEYYEGVDDLNRGNDRLAWRQKPPGQIMPNSKQSTRSTVFPNITGPYVDAATARVADMLLPTDDRSWALKPTPIPEQLEVLLSAPKPVPQLGVVESELFDAEFQQFLQTQQGQLYTAVKAEVEDMKRRAEGAELQIEDWQVQCQYHAEVRKVLEDAGRIGVGVLKGPVPTGKRGISYVDGQIQITQVTYPGSKWVDPWKFYPDPACGEDIHNGGYTWEYDFITKKQLRELKAQTGSGYIPEQIDRCLEEGPIKATAVYDPTGKSLEQDRELKGRFQMWIYHGTAEREDLEAAGCDCSGITDPHIPAMIVMVNNHVIKAALNPLDTGDFPYDVMVWRRRAGHWTGIGVARQVRVPQKIVTGGTRHLMDNAGLAAGPMIVFKQGVVLPADSVAGIAPRKVFYIAENDDTIDDARKAIGIIKVDMLVAELLEVINLGLRLAEETTGLPSLLQGQMGQAPDTVGGMSMLNNNATAVLRRLARLFDDRVTEPHTRRYYAWLLQYGEDESIKGDFMIDARGSSALVERDIQNQEIAQMAQIVSDPSYGLDKKKWIVEYLKSRRLDPKKFEFDDEEWKKILEQMAQPPPDNTLQAAQMRAESAVAVAQIRAQSEAEKQASVENIKERGFQIDVEKFQATQQFDMMMAELDQDVTAYQEMMSKGQNDDQLKTRMAEVALKIKAMYDLSAMDKPKTTPPAEPAGKAPAGRQYEK